jgi:gliding motility-associated-like protein
MKLLKKINKLNVKLKFYLLTFCISCINIGAQTITPQVINSAGGNWTLPNGITVSDNIGEPFVTTISNSNNMITQGFLQNFVVANVFSVSIIKNDVTCSDKNDGNISTAITTNLSSFSTQYTWTPQSVCPLNNCSSVDSLKAGTYTLVTQITFTIGQTQYDTLITSQVTINDQNGPCKVKIYSGVTPNGDGNNDVFTIDNISEFPKNHLLIYNRWGRLVYEANGYDNITKFWPTKEESGNLSSTTYFYLLDLGDGSPVIKNWIEVLKN